MTKEQILTRLEEAQTLLFEVYSEAGETGDRTLESLMSAADTCICEAIDYLEK